MFSCLSFTRRNTKESKQGSGTGITLEHTGCSMTLSGNVRANATLCQCMLILVFRAQVIQGYEDGRIKSRINVPALSISTVCRLGGMRFSATAFR